MISDCHPHQVRCLWERWPPEAEAPAPSTDGASPPGTPPGSEPEAATCESAETEPDAPDAPPPPPPPPFVRVEAPQRPLHVAADAVVCIAPRSLRAANVSVRVDRGDGVVVPPVEAPSTAPSGAAATGAAGAVAGAPSGLVYAYYAPTIISAVEPLGGPYQGGTRLTVHGSFFERRPALERRGGRPLCRFGLAVGPPGGVARAETATAALALAAATAAAAAAAASFEAGYEPESYDLESSSVPSDGHQIASSVPSEADYEPESYDLESPEDVGVGGGAALSALSGPTLYVPAVWNGSSRATCLAPAWPRRWWPTEPSNGRLSSLALGFLPDGAEEAIWWPRSDGTLTTAPRWAHLDSQLSAVRPASGPRAAGTRVTLLGRGLGVYADEFGSDFPSLCRLGGAPPTPVHAIDETRDELVCEMPACLGCSSRASPGAAAAADDDPPCCRWGAALPVAVALNGRDWIGGQPPVRFRYYDPPSVSALGALPMGSPLAGPSLGGTPVTVRGRGFQTVPNVALDARCRFGHVVVGVARVSDQEVLCVTPPHRSGTVSVAVAANGVDFVPSANGGGSTAPSTTPGAGFTFEYQCTGYPDGPTCVAP